MCKGRFHTNKPHAAHTETSLLTEGKRKVIVHHDYPKMFSAKAYLFVALGKT